MEGPQFTFLVQSGCVLDLQTMIVSGRINGEPLYQFLYFSMYLNYSKVYF